MWHSYPHCIGQPELVFFDTTPGSTTPRDPYEPYVATVNGTRFSAHGGGFGAFHVLLFLNGSGQTLVSLSDRYAVRLTHRAFSAGLFNDRGEYLIELLDNGSVAESAVMSSITTPDFFAFVPSLVMVCIGCAFEDDGDCLLYANVANYGLPFFGSETDFLSANFCCFGAGTVQLRTPCVVDDAVGGVSSVTFAAVGLRGGTDAFSVEALIAHASALPGALQSVAEFVPDTVSSRLARQGTAVGSLQSRSRISFAAAGRFQGATFMDSAGHPEAGRPFAFATNATVPRDVAFVRPNVAWRSNVSSDHGSNELLARLEVSVDEHLTGPPAYFRAFRRPAISVSVSTGAHGNNEYKAASSQTLSLFNWPEDTLFTSFSNVFVVAELTFIEHVNDPLFWSGGNSFPTNFPLIDDRYLLRVDFRGGQLGWSGQLSAGQASTLLAGDELALPLPSPVTSTAGGPAYIRIRGVGP